MLRDVTVRIFAIFCPISDHELLIMGGLSNKAATQGMYEHMQQENSRAAKAAESEVNEKTAQLSAEVAALQSELARKDEVNASLQQQLHELHAAKLAAEKWEAACQKKEDELAEARSSEALLRSCKSFCVFVFLSSGFAELPEFPEFEDQGRKGVDVACLWKPSHGSWPAKPGIL